MDYVERCRHHMWSESWGQGQEIDFDTGPDNCNMRPWPAGIIHSKTLSSPEALKAGWGESEARAKPSRIDYLIDFPLIACQ